MIRTPATAAALLVLAGCGQPAVLAPERPKSEAEKAGYLPAPEVTGVSSESGAVVVRGRAQPDGRVRAATLGGEAFGATADAQGRFVIELPAQGRPVLADFSVEEGERSTLAEGWLFVPPGDPRHAAMLRAGAPARSLDPAAPLIAAVDFDAGGGLAVSGRAEAGAEVRLAVDGAAAPSVQADARGRFGFRLTRMTPGPHRLRVESGGRSEERTVTLTATPPSERFEARRAPQAWRVEWATPGAGGQTTLVFTGAGS